jgi:hypothetical protein
MVSISETFVYLNKMKQLLSQEKFVEFSNHGIFMTYNKIFAENSTVKIWQISSLAAVSFSNPATESLSYTRHFYVMFH